MNKTAIKNFAIWARNKLIADITYRAGLMGIAEDGIKAALPQSTKDTEFYDIGTKEPYSITGEAVRQRRRLAELIEQKAKPSDYKTAYRSVLEEVAYTWFNRLIAIRFMEVNDYLPSRIRVLSSESKDKLEPDLVTTPFDADLELTAAETETIMRLKIDNQVDDLFRLLFVKQCNALNRVLPKLFEKTADYTELLLNVSVTDQDGVVYHLVHDIDEDDFNIEKGGQVEIIGWLYQYYNTEPKDEAFALLKKNVKITKERIPAATQLFTPDWIVRYMVENSLGRLWLEGHPNDDLKAGWKYYLDEAEQEADVEAQLAQIREEYKTIKPDDIKVIDPCMGSGHILVYAFDVLMQIYEAAGYTQREAAKSILENNLYGLDIDDRAFQLAYFAVMMKARQYNRRILNGEPDCHIYSIQESNTVNRNHLKYFGAGMDKLERNNALNQLTGLLDTFVDAKEYGSILNIDDCDWGLLRRFVEQSSEGEQVSMDSFGLEDTKEQLRVLIDVGQTLAQKYDVVVTNPPYMGSANMDSCLYSYIKKYYADYKSDLFAAFILKANDFTRKSGYYSLITQQAWMFKSSYRNLRPQIYQNTIISLLHLGAHAFDELNGEVVQTVAFTLQKADSTNYKGVYCALDSYTSEKDKQSAFFNGAIRYYCSMKAYKNLPNQPTAYWITSNQAETFTMFAPLENQGITACAGLNTSNNDQFVRLWYEPDINKIGFGCKSHADLLVSKKRYALFNKGGGFRKWYGNQNFVILFDSVNYDILSQIGNHLPSRQYYFLPAITWNRIAAASVFSARMCNSGFAFDDVSPSAFVRDELKYYTVGLMNAKPFKYLLSIMNRGMKTETGNVQKVPFAVCNDIEKEVEALAVKCVRLAQDDWDSFETSWDFQRHPLLCGCSIIEAAYTEWEAACNDRFNQLKANEEELNRIFIDVYGLQDELTPEVEDKDVTVRKADLGRDIRSLISCAVGCMFGRYSLDRPGLVFAGGDFDQVYWKHKGQAPLDEQGEPIGGGYAGISLAEYHYPRFHDAANWEDATLLTFEPDKDNILPITDEEYFPDDIVGLFCSWLKKVYGEDTLEGNLDFIAKALGNKGNTSREIIRNYFLNDFFKDHCQTYSVTGSGKRPIYWLFDSGKQNGFKALVYMHRYDENTIGNLRIDYLHRMERVYDNELARMQDIIDNSKVAREVTQATKRREKLQKQLKECKEYDERIAHLALARIPINLDDGVKVNYEKVQTVDGVKYPVLAKI